MGKIEFVCQYHMGGVEDYSNWCGKPAKHIDLLVDAYIPQRAKIEARVCCGGEHCQVRKLLAQRIPLPVLCEGCMTAAYGYAYPMPAHHTHGRGGKKTTCCGSQGRDHCPKRPSPIRRLNERRY